MFDRLVHSHSIFVPGLLNLKDLSYMPLIYILKIKNFIVRTLDYH